jgi:ubiquinone/menaquinone biosynthesis C-methylase UbiE
VRTSVDYDLRQHRVYGEGRALSATRAELWRGIFRRYLDRPSSRILDLGCGSGIYSRLIAEACDADVLGVDPSVRMLELARHEHPHPRVRYVDGSAEQIPLGDAACEAVLMSQVAHHVSDHDACARELRRVLRPRGLVLVRGILPESLPHVAFLRFFPSARPIARRQAESLVRLLATMTQNGLRRLARESIQQETAASMLAYHERVKLRAISTLELLEDSEFEAGLARMRQAAAQERPAPVREQIDLIVLERL